LLEIRPAAIAEAQRLSPDLQRAQLVRLDDISKMHDLLVDVEEPLLGGIVHTSA
jgi:hypothetical protein